MGSVVILGGGAAGLAAAIGAAQRGAQVTLAERNPRPGKKLLATGNGRCNLDNLASSDPARYFTADPVGLERLLAAIDREDLPGWWEALGLWTRRDEEGRVYPYSNQAADLTGLLLRWAERLGVKILTGWQLETLAQSRGGYSLRLVSAEGEKQTLWAQGVICALGGSAGPQFGTDGFGPDFAARCGGRVEPLYPCLTPMQCAGIPREQLRKLAGLRAKGAAALLDGGRPLAREKGEIQFTDYGLSGICIMQLSGLLAPGRGPKRPAVALDLFPQWEEPALAEAFARRARQLPGQSLADFWLGLADARLGAALWAAAGLPEAPAASLPAESWQALARCAKGWVFDNLSPCGWKQAQTTGGGLALGELEEDFQLKGCPGLYFVGETLDCAGSCGGFNLHWAFGSGLAAGRAAAAASGRAPRQEGPRPGKPRRKK